MLLIAQEEHSVSRSDVEEPAVKSLSYEGTLYSRIVEIEN